MGEFTIAVLPGDGIGPEVVSQGVRVIEGVGARFNHRFHLKQGLLGGAAIEQRGRTLPPETIDLCRSADAVLVGAVGDPRWDHLPPPQKAEAGLTSLRRELGIFVNLRPIKVFPHLEDCTPFKPEVIRGVDFVMAREMMGGVIHGKPRGLWQTARGRRAVNTIKYAEPQVEEFLRVVFEVARGRKGHLGLAIQDNVLETSQLWRQVCAGIVDEYPEVTVDYMYPDVCAMQLVRNPAGFDVLALDNLLTAGMLNDQGAAIMGSMGMTASAEMNPRRRSGQGGEGVLAGVFGLYEPVHGSAPKYTGQNKVNPIATILSVALMLRYSLSLYAEAEAVESAIEKALERGYRTYDIMEQGRQQVGTDGMGEIVLSALLEG
ncbi:MAG: 3-isopropylmalate dehydrogenase [Dehalococcoidia bacterium]|jgi:3-isopropylmalate dehydrogenase|nr:3-isopropylmalate dehydrogenase [Dehalococcoidia bacterium]